MPTREPTAIKELSAILGEGARFEGKLFFDGRVRVDGRFRGEIESEDVLVLGETSDVEATVRVGTLIVLGGTLRGDVRAAKSVELHAPARVYGNITSPQLLVDRGVLFQGQSRVSTPEPEVLAEQPQAGAAPDSAAPTGGDAESQEIEDTSEPASVRDD